MNAQLVYKELEYHWLERDNYNSVYWEMFNEGYRGRTLRRKVAEVYRSIYGN